MKLSLASKSSSQSGFALDRKLPVLRSGPKSSAHRYERRKIREQLRHLDWALAGVD
jgi:acyl-CoA synthetase (AMP-forming)/AMP-acid ligase II